MKDSIFLLFLILLSGLVLSACTATSKDEWSLMICENVHSPGECGDIQYVLNGYQTQKDCMEKGIELNNEAGFECGLNCESGEFATQVCDEVCNRNGCS